MRSHSAMGARTGRGGRRTPMLMHLGPHKTGSTVFQDFCHSHRDALASAGIWYPSTALWGSQHALLASAIVPDHPFLGSANAGRRIGDMLDEIASGRPSHASATLISSEVFWEILADGHRTASRLFRPIRSRWDLVLVVVDRPIRERLWSSLKHAARSGFAMDPTVHLSLMAAREANAERALGRIGGRILHVRHERSDVIPALLLALANANKSASRGRESKERMSSLLRTRSSEPTRGNEAPRIPTVAAGTLEFAFRLTRLLPPGARCPRVGAFLEKATRDSRIEEAWRDLPEERSVRTLAWKRLGTGGSLLDDEQRKRWSESLSASWLSALARECGVSDRVSAVTGD